MPRDRDTNRISDRIRFEHILAAAKDIAFITTSRKRNDLDTDMILRRALLHAIQEVGEAAARVSDAGRGLIPTLPWGSIVQIRHIVVHVYWGIDMDRIWRAATEQVPKLIDLVEDAIRQLPLPPDIEKE